MTFRSAVPFSRKLWSERRLVTSAARALSSSAELDKLVIFDTTLRDGEQSPGATLNTAEKLAIAKQLSRLGVDVCEAGFPIASPGDFEAVKLIATEVGPMMENRTSGKPMQICGLARAMEGDIERCYDAVSPAPLHRIHTFLATSDLHLEHKLKISRAECIEQVAKIVKFAKDTGADIEFSPEDAGRSEPDFLVDVLAVAIEAGATTLNIPDTTGYTLGSEYGDLIAYLRDNTPGGKAVIFSTHCHNDLGLATANTLAGVMNGARQAEVTLNGIGERAGNTALEEVVMAIKTRQHLFPVHVDDLDTVQIMRSSQMVSHYTGMLVQRNKAIVGQNAFAHEAGIHQDGMLKNPLTYEIMTPESVGLKTSLVLGKHSGRAAVQDRLQDLGYKDLSRDQLNEAFVQFKAIADAKSTVTDADLEAIMTDAELIDAGDVWNLEHVYITSGNNLTPSATVTMSDEDGTHYTDAAVGVGSVDAVFKAIERICGVGFVLDNFTVQSVTDSSDALGRVTVRIQPAKPGLDAEPVTYSGYGTHIDILVASARAVVNAVNKMLLHERPEHQRKVEFPGKLV